MEAAPYCLRLRAIALALRARRATPPLRPGESLLVEVQIERGTVLVIEPQIPGRALALATAKQNELRRIATSIHKGRKQ